MHDSVNKFARRFTLSHIITLATLAGVVIISGCHQGVSAAQQADNSSPDPADANMAPVDGSQQPQAQPQPSTGGAPVYRVAPQPLQNQSQQQADQYAPDNTGAPADEASYDPNYDAQVDAGQDALDEQASEPPPQLPTYDQPEAPGPNYLWTPGYWGYAPAGYYWVPGVWCAAPYYGALWTPGYWGFYNGFYRFHRGYWGPYIGFYGGINYGFGYIGTGYRGGYWNSNHFYYNTAVNRVNVSRVTYVYNRTVIVNNNVRVSYNGGRGGLNVRPRPAELAAMRQTRTPPMTTQLQNQRSAAGNRQQFFNQNKGRPAIVAAPRPLPADRGIQRPQLRPIQQPQTRPAQPNQPQVQPTRPGTQPQIRPNQPQVRPNQPETRPNQPQVRPDQPQLRPNQPQVRPDQQQPRPNQPQVRPDQQQLRPNQPQVRPSQPQLRPNQPQVRPEQPQNRPVPQQARPQPTQRQDRPTQQRPQPQSKPAQGPRPESRQAPRQDEKRDH